MADCFARLAQTPTLAAERREYDPPVRIHRYEIHLIVYLEDDRGILIVRVLHEAMDVSTRLSGE